MDKFLAEIVLCIVGLSECAYLWYIQRKLEELLQDLRDIAKTVKGDDKK